jgi:predicted alpha/beta superfamily hydrolase
MSTVPPHSSSVCRGMFVMHADRRALAIALCSVTVSLSTPVSGQAPASEPLISVSHTQIKSHALHATRDVFVWVPNGDMGPVTRFPVLVMLDAQDQNQFRSAIANVRFLIDRKAIPPLIIIGVPFGVDRNHDLTPPGSVPPLMQQLGETVGGADATIAFLTDELLPWADAHYPTLAVKLLAGHSLGGLLAVRAFAYRPAAFRIVIAMSPPLSWDDGKAGTELAHRIAADSVHPRALFISDGGAGIDDTAATQFAALLRSIVPDPESVRLSFAHHRYEADNHSMTPLPSLIDGLRWAFAPLVVPIDSIVAALSAGSPKDSTVALSIIKGIEDSYRANATLLGVPDAPFPEYPLRRFAYYCLGANLVPLAGRLLREDAERYPRSTDAIESLGEGLLANADTAAAIAAFQRAVAISTRGDDINAIASRAMLRALGKDNRWRAALASESNKKSESGPR